MRVSPLDLCLLLTLASPVRGSQSGNFSAALKSQKFEARKTLMTLKVTSCSSLMLQASPKGQGLTKVTED